jgi:hypothetical protein
MKLSIVILLMVSFSYAETSQNLNSEHGPKEKKESIANEFRLGYASCINIIKMAEEKIALEKKKNKAFKLEMEELMQYENCHLGIHIFELKATAAWIAQKIENSKESDEKMTLSHVLKDLTEEIKNLESEGDI